MNEEKSQMKYFCLASEKYKVCKTYTTDTDYHKTFISVLRLRRAIGNK